MLLGRVPPRRRGETLGGSTVMVGVVRRVSLLAVKYPPGLPEISLPPHKIFECLFLAEVKLRLAPP